MAEPKRITVAPESERSRLSCDMIVVGDVGYVSGVRPVDLANDRVPIPEKIETQTRKIFENLDAILGAAGLERRHLAFVRIHLVDFERLIERVNKTYLDCIGAGPLPARTAVGVSQLTRGVLIEMDFVVRA
jgi:enamine deaminase RidA (YjgF/YER057c/UK114 family)